MESSRISILLKKITLKGYNLTPDQCILLGISLGKHYFINKKDIINDDIFLEEVLNKFINEIVIDMNLDSVLKIPEKDNDNMLKYEINNSNNKNINQKSNIDQSFSLLDYIDNTNSNVNSNNKSNEPNHMPELININVVIQPKNPEENIKCDICLENYNIYDGDNYPLDCGHVVHKLCFDTFLRIEISEKQNCEIKCPSCGFEISGAVLQQILRLLGNELYDKYESNCLKGFMINNRGDQMWCPTPDCKYFFFLSEGDTRFYCPLCTKEYCLKCRTPFHNQISCDEFQKATNENYLNNEFDKAVKQMKFMQCPNCKFWIVKNEGCNHITCRCKHEFCYICGKSYERKVKKCLCK